MLETVLNALLELRSPFALYENDIHLWVENRLREAGLAFAHEARIGPGCRIDYLVGGTGTARWVSTTRLSTAPHLRYAQLQ